MNLLDMDLKIIVGSCTQSKILYGYELFAQIVELSKTYDVIIDNGKVILSEKS